MITENLSTLKIHKLTQAQYDRELEAGRIDANALYLTPDEEVDLSGYATKDHTHENSSGGFAHGTGASAGVGGAIGINATSTWGGAVGGYASSTRGFSGGYNAESSVDSIQLGAGTNTEEKSLQVYDKQLMNGNGYIPASRLISHSETITGELSGVTYYEHLIEKTWSGGIPIVRSVNWTVGESTYAAAHVIFTVVDDDFNNLLKISVQRPSGVTTSTDVSYCLQVDILGI